MADPPPDVVAHPFRQRHRRRRTLDEWVTVLAPGMSQRLGSFLRRRLPLHSRLRGAITARVICSQYDAFSRGDVKLFLARCHPEMEYEMRDESGVQHYRGRAGLKEFLEEWTRTVWDEYHVEIEELLETSAGRLLAVCRERGRGKGSGVRVERQIFEVITLRDGLGFRNLTVQSREEAFAELGLAAQPSSASATTPRATSSRP